MRGGPPPRRSRTPPHAAPGGRFGRGRAPGYRRRHGTPDRYRGELTGALDQLAERVVALGDRGERRGLGGERRDRADTIGETVEANEQQRRNERPLERL